MNQQLNSPMDDLKHDRNRLIQELAKGKRLVREMFEAQEAFGMCDYPSLKLHDIWMVKEKKVKEWSGK